MLILEDALQKFESLDPEVIFIVNSDRFTQKITELSERVGVDLNSAVLYFIVGFLRSEELAEYLEQEKDLEEEKAKMIADELRNQVLKPMEDRLSFLNSDPDKENPTVTQEKEILRKIFLESLISEMNEFVLVKNAVNLRIFDILEQDLNFKRELEQQLYKNNELLTKDSITLDDKSSSPTIGNWLKDFIAKKGTDDFSTIALSDYLTNSANTKNLTSEDRQKVFDLLNLYRNIKFFPATVEGKPMEEWRIIPFDASEVKKFVETKNKATEEKKNEEVKGNKAVSSSELTTEQKLAEHDWHKIVGIERRALLEELGVSLKDFVKWSEGRKL